jgi:hypothetical protein
MVPTPQQYPAWRDAIALPSFPGFPLMASIRVPRGCHRTCALDMICEPIVTSGLPDGIKSEAGLYWPHGKGEPGGCVFDDGWV